MKIVRINNGKVVEILPEETYELGIAHWYGEAFAAQCVAASDDVKQGWTYSDGVFAAPDEVEPTPAELRRIEYATRKCVSWEGDLITIDEANLLHAAYLAEGDTDKAAALQILIAEQKVAIRAELPDER